MKVEPLDLEPTGIVGVSRTRLAGRTFFVCRLEARTSPTLRDGWAIDEQITNEKGETETRRLVSGLASAVAAREWLSFEVAKGG